MKPFQSSIFTVNFGYRLANNLHGLDQGIIGNIQWWSQFYGSAPGFDHKHAFLHGALDHPVAEFRVQSSWCAPLGQKNSEQTTMAIDQSDARRRTCSPSVNFGPEDIFLSRRLGNEIFLFEHF